MISTPPGDEPRIEVLELVPRRFVPVGVEAQQRDLRSAPVPGACLPPCRARSESARAGYPTFADRRPERPRATRSTSTSPRLPWRSLPSTVAARRAVEVDVAVGRGRHALEGVEEVEVAVGDRQRQQRLRRGHHAAAAPDAALDDRARDTPACDVLHGLDERVDALRARHRVGRERNRACLVMRRDRNRDSARGACLSSS